MRRPKVEIMTQAQYDALLALDAIDANTVYFIVDEVVGET